MSVRDMQAQRKRVRAWRKKLRALAEGVTSKRPKTMCRELYALDIAMLETAIYSLCAHGRGVADEVVNYTLDDILRAYGDVNHWRNRESQMERAGEL